MSSNVTDTTSYNYWISPTALTILRNAMSDPNRIMASTNSGAQIVAFVDGVIGYDDGHNYQHWPLVAYPTEFDTNTEKYIYVAIPRSIEYGTVATVVYPSEHLDIYGFALRDTKDKDADGNIIQKEVLVGDEKFWYISLGGILSSSGDNGTIEREWLADIDYGYLDSSLAYDAGPIETDWYRYDRDKAVPGGNTGLVTFKKDLDLLRNDKGIPQIAFQIMRVGNALLRWRDDINALAIEHIAGDTTPAHLYATGGVAAYGLFPTSGGGDTPGGDTPSGGASFFSQLTDVKSLGTPSSFPKYWGITAENTFAWLDAATIGGATKFSDLTDIANTISAPTHIWAKKTSTSPVDGIENTYYGWVAAADFGKAYTGDGTYISVDNTKNKISFLKTLGTAAYESKDSFEPKIANKWIQLWGTKVNLGSEHNGTIYLPTESSISMLDTDGKTWQTVLSQTKSSSGNGININYGLRATHGVNLNGTKLELRAYSNSSNYTEATLTTTGLGIGVTAPTHKLHVNGTIRIGDFILGDDGNGNFRISKYDNAPANFYATGGVSAYGHGASSEPSGAAYFSDLLDDAIQKPANYTGKAWGYNGSSWGFVDAGKTYTAGTGLSLSNNAFSIDRTTVDKWYLSSGALNGYAEQKWVTDNYQPKLTTASNLAKLWGHDVKFGETWNGTITFSDTSDVGLFIGNNSLLTQNNAKNGINFNYGLRKTHALNINGTSIHLRSYNSSDVINHTINFDLNCVGIDTEPTNGNALTINGNMMLSNNDTLRWRLADNTNVNVLQCSSGGFSMGWGLRNKLATNIYGNGILMRVGKGDGNGEESVARIGRINGTDAVNGTGTLGMHVYGGLRIGDALLSWDNTNRALKISDINGGGQMHLYATGGVAAYSAIGGFDTLSNLDLTDSLKVANQITTGKIQIGNTLFNTSTKTDGTTTYNGVFMSANTSTLLLGYAANSTNVDANRDVRLAVTSARFDWSRIRELLVGDKANSSNDKITYVSKTIPLRSTGENMTVNTTIVNGVQQEDTSYLYLCIGNTYYRLTLNPMS